MKLTWDKENGTPNKDTLVQTPEEGNALKLLSLEYYLMLNYALGVPWLRATPIVC